MTDIEQKALELVLEWREGSPPKPWSEEWFIALTTYGDRVVLRSLPEEYTYDFTTADSTYLRADKIAKWMQFPDSQYIAPYARAHELDKASHAAELREQAERFSEAVTGFWNYCKTTDTPFPAALSPFILAPADPLVVEAREICARVCEGWTDIPNGRATAYRDGMHDDEADFAYALEALRKAAIVKKDAVNG